VILNFEFIWLFSFETLKKALLTGDGVGSAFTSYLPETKGELCSSTLMTFTYWIGNLFVLEL
jgi:hypothetical protein